MRRGISRQRKPRCHGRNPCPGVREANRRLLIGLSMNASAHRNEDLPASGPCGPAFPDYQVFDTCAQRDDRYLQHLSSGPGCGCRVIRVANHGTVGSILCVARTSSAALGVNVSSPPHVERCLERRDPVLFRAPFHPPM